MRVRTGLVLWLGYLLQVSAQQQVPFAAPKRQLSGRFLHITDLHPDGHYKPHTAISKACHRARNKKHKNISGYFGVPYSKCDSPFSLTNTTLDYIGKEWADSIDFVVWTGDNARHDNDHKVPRTLAEIYDLNRAMARRMDDLFLSKGIPVIPSLGISSFAATFPHACILTATSHQQEIMTFGPMYVIFWVCTHLLAFDLGMAQNILAPGPNGITNEFSVIWSKFIPFPHLQVFQRGAYFSVEVIPNSLAVISLNTLYFYDSNKAVEGCPFTNRNDPGNLEMDWLEVQLEMYRSRGMQVYLTGHVPPSPGNYWDQCYVRYVELSLQYQDTIVGHLYGHMNDDFFFFLDARDLEIPKEVSSRGHKHLFQTLMSDFEELSQKASRYSVVNVSPSVVPNPYIPTFRIFSYNTTGSQMNHVLEDSMATVSTKRRHGHRKSGGDKQKLCREKAHEETWRCHLKNVTWHNQNEAAPSRANGLWTPLGYAQYYLPGLEKARKKKPPKFKLEYLTYRVEKLHPQGNDTTSFQYPVPLKHLPKSLRTPPADRQPSKSKFAPYEMDDLTIGTWLELGRRLGGGDKALRRHFKKYMRVKKKKKKQARGKDTGGAAA